MNQSKVDALARIAQGLLTDKWYLTSMHFLWVYDYFLTFGDEVTYAWHGMRSRIFALFLVTRYTPVLYLVWVNYTMYDFSETFCNATKWATVWIAVTVTVLAQVAIALRVYAITERNKLFGIVLAVIIVAHLSLGIFLMVLGATGPGSPIPEPKAVFAPFMFCTSRGLRHNGFAFVCVGIAFDVVAFLIIVFRAKRRTMRYPGIPSLLDTILRDATMYFVVIFSCQIVLLFFLAFAPVQIMFTPVVANTSLTPIMASRLMLSLKKASVKPEGPWSIETMSTHVGGEPKEGGTTYFPSRTLGLNRRTRGTSNQSRSDEGDVELDSL